MKRIITITLAIILMISACMPAATVSAADTAQKTVSAAKTTKAAKKEVVTKKQRDGFYKRSAFVGSSIGLGQKYYFNRQGKNYLGSPKMLVKGCYSFYNDKHRVSKWMITYKGKNMQAREAIKAAKVKRVFISMGTNDFVGDANKVYKDYVDYLKGIRKMNPTVVIFIESTTSVSAARQGKYLNSRNIAKLNKLMAEYCKKNKDMYFIDVSSKLNDKNGHLKRKYASDNYVHLTDSAYKIWTNQMIKYTDKLILKERAAKKAVAKAEKSKKEADVTAATNLVNALELSTVKDELTARLKAIVIKQ